MRRNLRLYVVLSIILIFLYQMVKVLNNNENIFILEFFASLSINKIGYIFLFTIPWLGMLHEIILEEISRNKLLFLLMINLLIILFLLFVEISTFIRCHG